MNKYKVKIRWKIEEGNLVDNVREFRKIQNEWPTTEMSDSDDDDIIRATIISLSDEDLLFLKLKYKGLLFIKVKNDERV